MPTTYTLISSNVLTSSAASVTFSSIPATYTDLVLRISVRGTSTDTTDYPAVLQINDTSSTLSYTEVGYWGGTPASYNNTGTFYIPQFSLATTTANTFGTSEVYFPNYTVSQNKPFSAFGAPENNGAINSRGISAFAGLWRNTAAITKLYMTMAAGNFESGSSFYLYGIKNS
jgi:hypothetical protein